MPCPCLWVWQDRRFSDEIDKLTGYKTKSLLCMPIRSSDGEIIGVAQAINKTSSVEIFAEDDEKVAFSLRRGARAAVVMLTFADPLNIVPRR